MGQAIQKICGYGALTFDQPLCLMLHSSLPLVHIKPTDLNEINSAIVQNQNKVFEYEGYSIEYQCINGKMNNRELAKLIVKPIMPGKGLIVYEQGYYLGMIRNSKPNDLAGRFVLANKIRSVTEDIVVQLVIRGSWEDGEWIGKCRGCNTGNLELFTLQWNRPGRDLIIEFSNGSIKRYQGYIDNTATGQFKNCLNGSKATIYFRDGSKYLGSVRDGQMNTQGSQQALFVSADGREQYLGGFLKGQRHGNSKTIMKSEADGPELAFSMQWNDGEPNVETYQRMNKDDVSKQIRELQDQHRN